MTLREQLMRDEGLRLRPYRDSVGKLTIGYGRNLDDKGISIAEARAMLDQDLGDAMAALTEHLPWTEDLPGIRRAVLANMAFNLGTAGLLSFRKMLAAVQAGDYATAAAEMLDSKWARQVGDRATRLAEQMRTGEWQ